jgi:hypothetical protein
MKLRAFLLSTTILAGASLSASSALAADIYVPRPIASTPPVLTAPAPAVDGVNWKLGIFGGSLGSNGIYALQGAVSIPLGQSFGLQIDGLAGSYDGDFLGDISAHAFWRDPSRGLLGLYGGFTTLNDEGGNVNAWRISAEAAAYWGNITLQGIAGVEGGNETANFDIQTRFFDKIDLTWYATPNLALTAGHRYVGGINALALKAEYGLNLGPSTMASLFAEGRIGEDDYKGVWGGLKVYFGNAKNKSLIRRHREDDPIVWTPDTLFTILNNKKPTTTEPPSESYCYQYNPETEGYVLVPGQPNGGYCNVA